MILGGEIEGNVRPYLDIVDQLRSIGVEKDFPTPQIAVMGDQSSGKSSVLESISGIPTSFEIRIVSMSNNALFFDKKIILLVN